MSVFDSKPWLDAYAKGVPTEIEPVTDTLVGMMETSCRRYRRRTALEFFGATVRYGELGEQIARAAEGLRKRGVAAGDRVAIVLPNCPQHVVAFYAVLRLGAVVVEHNPLYTKRELRHQFEDHGATVAIVWDKLYDTIRDFPQDVPVNTVISVDITRALPLSKRLALRLPIKKAREQRTALTAGALSTRWGKPTMWNDIVTSRPLRHSHPKPGLQDTAVLQYTSGTTGTPKGAVLSHANVRSNAAQGRAWVPELRLGRETFYAVLPLFHAYGLTLCLTFAMSTGARVVLMPRFDTGMVLDAMKTSPATFLPAVPPIYDRLVRAARERKVSLSGIRFAISGAMSLPPSTVEKWESATGGVLVEGYGMTEASPVAVGNPMGPSRRAGTIGVPFPSTEIRVVDPENPLVDRGFDEAGELLLRGPQIFNGYWNRPSETAAALLPGGWLRTGDIVTVSRDGFITVVDRIKELIITGGFNVAPTEVEQVLLAHPAIADAAVVGVPGRDGDERVTAAIVLEPGMQLDVAELRSFCKDRLAAYKVPRSLVEVDELPRSIVGKVLRREVKELVTARA